MQSASETPSSHLRAQSCPADQRGVGCGCDRRANPGTKSRRPARVPAARDRPAGNHERRRDSPRSFGSKVERHSETRAGSTPPRSIKYRVRIRCRSTASAWSACSSAAVIGTGAGPESASAGFLFPALRLAVWSPTATALTSVAVARPHIFSDKRSCCLMSIATSSAYRRCGRPKGRHASSFGPA